jgi:hypothetical protein
LATRFASALPVGAYAIWHLARHARRLTLPTVLGFAVPAAVLAWYMHHVTGSFQSPQAMYYGISDAPQGCFGYGFSAHTGCLHEHGDFVRANLPHGYGLWPVLKTTARRVFMHLGDPLNGGPLLAVGLVGLTQVWKRVRPLVALIVLQIIAYAPFYFDGNYPGGGARFFADVLPLEHVVLALSLSRLHAVRCIPARLRPHLTTNALALAPALSFLLLSVHGSFEHQQLRDRAPSIELPGTPPNAIPPGSVVFTREDDAFNLGSARGNETWLRLREDDVDADAWDTLQQPYAVIMRHNVLARYTPPRNGRYEAESFWPALHVVGQAPVPVWSPGASNGRALYVKGESTVQLGRAKGHALPSRVRVRGHEAHGEVVWGTQVWDLDADAVAWRELEAHRVGDATNDSIEIRLRTGELWLDAFVGVR